MIYIFIFILSLIILTISLFLFYKSNQIKINKNKQQEEYQQSLKTQISYLEQSKNALIRQGIEKQHQLEQNINNWKKERQIEIQNYIKNKKELADQYVRKNEKLASQAIISINNEIQDYKIIIEQQKTKTKNQLDKLKASLSAGVEARLREQQKKDKINFYKLSINALDLSDVEKLENLKTSFHNPVVLSKLIWTQYFQKQTSELCDRVFGKKTISGIYKITDLLTEQCYIGQSVNIQDRIKQHCKCGLGIDSPSTNKLYNTMQRDKIWNFTFELLEQCSKQLLNEKEKFWIEMYQSNKFGLNTTKGNL